MVLYGRVVRKTVLQTVSTVGRRMVSDDREEIHHKVNTQKYKAQRTTHQTFFCMFLLLFWRDAMWTVQPPCRADFGGFLLSPGELPD